VKRMLQWFGPALIVGLVLIQFIRPDHTNPSIDASRTIQARTQIPPSVLTIVQRACDDCHSNHTVWPWYSQISPMSWYLQHDVQEGRRALNLSDWAAYEQRRVTRKLNEICEEVTKGAMPTRPYVWLHPSAKLSEADRQALCDWTRAERQRLEAATQSSLTSAP